MPIWKFNLKDEVIQNIDLPRGSKILSVQEQHRNPVLYVQVPHNYEHLSREIFVIHTFQTGNGESEGLTYINTIMFADGTYVEHFFYSQP